ncbi:MAG TPA: hypothetical protein VGR07_15260, partial [Thermoanaerobaculia bacterium]|nr:hypothetical protein [Thermoanaerobaculia bacterium]
RSWRPAGLDGGVFQLAVAPGTRAVYAVAGGTFFRSRDGGISWTSLSPGLLAAGVSPAVLSFSLSPAPDIVFAVAPPASGGDAEVFRSSDGGDSWRVAWRAPALTFPFRVLADPTDPRYVFALSQRGVHVSADGGATWSATTLPRQVIGLAVEYGPRHRVLALLLNGVSGIRTTEIAVSSDRGQTWRSRGGPVDAANLRADPTTPGGFVAVGATDLYRTTDAGQHWASVGKLPSSSALSLALDPVRPGVAFVAVPGGSLGSTVWKTATYGAVWAPFFRGIFAGDFRTVIADPAAPATLWASADSLSGSPYGLWKSTDRGATWAPGGFNEAFVPYLAFGGGHRLFAGVLGQGLKRSADGGQHWIQVALPFDNLRAVVTPTGEPNTVYVLAATQDGDTISAQLEVSLDAGVTWTTRKLPASLLEVSPGSPATLYANRRAETIVDPAGTDSVQRSTDRGATWTTILEAPGGLVTSIGLDPVNPQRVVVAYRRLAAPRTESIVQWTADGGATWHVLPP